MSEVPPVVVTFALPDESRDFVASLAGVIRPRGVLTTASGQLAGDQITIVHTGVGDSPAGRARLRDALAGDRPRLVISSGYAGGLHPGLRVGDLVLGENVSGPAPLAAARRLLVGETLHVGALLTQTAAAETAADKAALHAATGALAVDMETSWIANACTDAGIPLLSLRVISDTAAQSFPVPGHILFDAVRQRPRYIALPLWLLMHPSRIAPFAAFVRGLGPARTRLTRVLCRVIPSL